MVKVEKFDFENDYIFGTEGVLVTLHIVAAEAQASYYVLLVAFFVLLFIHQPTILFSHTKSACH
jgi:hypothetical protein